MAPEEAFNRVVIAAKHIESEVLVEPTERLYVKTKYHYGTGL